MNLFNRKQKSKKKIVQYTYLPFGYVKNERRLGPLLLILLILLFLSTLVYTSQKIITNLTEFPCGGKDNVNFGGILGYTSWPSSFLDADNNRRKIVIKVIAYSNCRDDFTSNRFVRVLRSGEICSVVGPNGTEELTALGLMMYRKYNETVRIKLLPSFKNDKYDDVNKNGEVVLEKNDLQFDNVIYDIQKEIDKILVHHPFYCGIMTGMEWQCVEFARRYLYIVKGLIFISVDGASDIFDLKVLYRVTADEENINSNKGKDNVIIYNYEDAYYRPVPMPYSELDSSLKEIDDKYKYHFDGYLNKGKEAPLAGDLIIYEKQKDMPFGHVAVITEIMPFKYGNKNRIYNRNLYKGYNEKYDQEKKMQQNSHEEFYNISTAVHVAEQNYDSLPWHDRGYSRTLTLFKEEIYAENIIYELIDNDGYKIIGWKRVGDRFPS